MAITANALTANFTDGYQAVFTTASVTPTGGAVVWLAVALRRDDAAGEPITPIVSGLSATWSAGPFIYYDQSSTRGKLFLFWASDHSGSGAISIDTTETTPLTHGGCVWSVTETLDTDTTTPIVAGQTATIAADQQNNTVTLPSAPTAGNATMSAIALYDATVTQEAGHTKLNQGGPATGNSNLSVATDFVEPGDQTHAWTFPVATHGIIGWEVAASSGILVTITAATETSAAQSFTSITDQFVTVTAATETDIARLMTKIVFGTSTVVIGFQP